MAGNKVGIILAVDGEREFRDAMTNAANAAKQVKAELQALEGAYSGNANSLEALTKKQELLEKQQGRVKAALEQAKAGYDNAQKAVEKHKTALSNNAKQIESAKKELERLKDTYGDASDEVKEQEQKLTELTRAQEENEKSLAAAETSVQQWAKKVSSASKDVQTNSKALNENEGYLDEAKSSADGCARSIDEYGNSVKSATDVTNDWGDAMKTGIAVAAADLAKSALSGIADKAKDAAKYVVEVGSSFEKAMDEVAAISGASTDELAKMSETAKKLGASTQFSATEVAEAFQYMSLAGWDTKTSLEAIDGVLQLAAASGMGLAEASDMVTDYLSAFRLEASDTNHMVDMLASAQANSNTKASQLGEAYGNCAAGMSTAGQSIETTTALLEAMANQGNKGSEAGTSLNSIMSQLTQKMEDGAIQIGETTIAVQDQEGNFRDLIDIVADVDKATQGMGSAERAAALSAVFNRTALKGLNQILNEGVENVRGYKDELLNCDGAAAAMAASMQDNLQGDLTTMNSALEGLGIAAYNYVEGPLRGVVQGVTEFISGITKELTPQKTALESFISGVKASNEEVEKSLENAKQSLSNFDADAEKLEGYSAILQEAAGATDLTAYQQYEVAQIVGELSKEIPELSDAWDEQAGVLQLTREEVENLMNAYAEEAKAEAYLNAMKASTDALWQSKINAAKADSAAKKAQDELTAAQENYNSSRDKYNRLRAESGMKPGEIADQEAEALKRAEKALEEANGAREDANKLEKEAQEEYDLTKSVVDELGIQYDEFGNRVKTASEEAAESAGNLGDAINEVDPDTLERLGKAAEDMKGSIENSMQSAVSIFKDFEEKSAESLDVIIKRLETQKEAIDGWARNMETLGAQIGEGISQEFYDYLAQLGPEQGADLVAKLVKSMESGDGEFEKVSQAWTEAMNVSAQADKLTEATTAGKDYASAMAQGMEDGQSEVEGSASQVAGAGVDTANSYQGEYYSAGQNLASGTGSGISSMASYVMEKAREIVRDALAAAKNEAGIHSPSKKWKKEVGEMLTKGMADGIQAGKADAVNAAQIVTDTVYDKATAWLAKKKKKQDISVEAEKDYWKRVENAAKSGVEAYKKQVARAEASAKKTDAAENKVLAAQISSRFGVSKTTTSGSGSNKKTVKKDTEKYYSEIFSAAKKYLENYETTHNVSLQQEKTYWTKLQKTLKKGTQAWYDAQKQINSINDQIKAAKNKTQSESLAADEAYVKKRTYQGKMDTESELAYWKQQIKGFKKYSDEWYTITDRIKSLEQDLASERAAKQAEMLASQEAYVKKRIYQEKMDTAAQIAYWEEQIKGYKQYSDEWYTITDNLKSLREQAAAEEAQKRSDLLTGMEKEVDRKRTLENKDAAWELAYWKERIANFSADTDEYLTIYKKIRALEEEAAASKPDPVEEARQQRQSLASVQSSILSKYKTYYKVSLKAEAQYWDKARKQFAEGTDERIEADQKYFDAVKNYTEQREQLEKDYLEEQQSIMDEEKANIAELTKAYTDAVSQREQAILQSFGLFDAWDNEGYTSEAMLRNARTQIEGLKLWEQEITELRKKNLPQELLDQLEEMGPDATANLYTLNRMTSSELNEWVKIWQEKQEIAKRQAEKQSKGLLGETAEGIADAQAEAQKKLADLKKQYDKDLAEMNSGISSSLAGMVGKAKTIGEDTVASLISGLKTKMDESLPGMETYYSDWERKWMNGMSRMNAATSAGAGSYGTQTVAVDTGNIAGILAAILASLNDVKDGVGTGATITMDQLTAKISTNMAASTYRSTRGGIV